ncbi:MAG: right-handed parallel beta-helix repeat-containing protein [Planctomycetaceae bacterium]|nr:right-handed parallel beta-helix repeat-containing protein [Planctomycetaceae bacterium]
MTTLETSRRQFLTLTGFAALSAGTRLARSAETPTNRPAVTSPRATSFDNAVEPNWDERLTITVGPKDADIVGTSHKALQAAVDYVANLGGGTVQLQAGKFVLRGAVHLRSGVRVRGAGDDTIITKIPSRSSKLLVDSDWYDQEITLSPGHGFEIGDSVCLRTKNAHHGNPEVLKRRLVARSGDRFKLDLPLKENYWQMGEPTANALFPLLTGEEIERITIEHLTLDGDRANNANLDGNYAGCIFLQDCRSIQIRDVTARNYNGDGISWQICHDVAVEDCRSHDHAGLGLHPGSGSQRPVMRRNKLSGNDIGLFFCWGVKYGLAEDNVCDGNRVGLSIGHRDTDNLIRGNRIENSRDVGVLFRPERGPTFCAHRNVIEHNTLVNNGGPTAAAVDVQGGTEDVTIRQNEIRDSRGPAERTGIRLGAETQRITVAENRIEGFATAIRDMKG